MIVLDGVDMTPTDDDYCIGQKQHERWGILSRKRLLDDER